MRQNSIFALLIAISIISPNTSAYTECPAALVNKIYTGDAGKVYIFLKDSGSFSIPPEDPNQKMYLVLHCQPI